MSATDLILHEEEFRKVVGLGERLRHDANARYVALIDRNGQPIASSGELPDVDKTALASLVAGNVAATETLAKMVGEQSFSSLYHEGEKDHLHMSAVGPIGILVVLFDERSSLGLVRLRVRQMTPDLEEVFNEMVERSRSDNNPELEEFGAAMAEITDEDIDSLFGDRI